MSILFEDVSFSYPKHPVFSHLDFEIPDGGVLVIMGESGCGKTTLLQLLTGHLSPTSGRISGLAKQRISMVFQEDRLCEDFSALTNVRLGLGRGVSSFGTDSSSLHSSYEKNELDELIRTHLGLVGLPLTADKKVSSFSGGMKRRTAIVRAILSDSDLLILDEPFKGLDSDTKDLVLSYVSTHIGPRTLILVTHDLQVAEAFHGQLLNLT